MKRYIITIICFLMVLLTGCAGKEDKKPESIPVEIPDESEGQEQEIISDYEGEAVAEIEMPYISEMKNPSYELFYGEWEISEVVYVDPVPTRGTEYTDQEVADVKSYYYDNTEIRKIRFTSDEIVINGNEHYDEITYSYVVFPAGIDYHIHFTMTLKDIGLPEDDAGYYLFVRAESGKSNKIMEFFIKDAATIIACYDGFYCVEYTKVSEDGNNNISAAINVEEFLLSEVPEIKEYEIYISEKSDNEACLLVEAVLEPRKIEGFSETYYAVYVGEQWETHAVNWDWFYVSSDLENILWYLLPEDLFMTLDEWRNSTYYRKINE